MSEKATEHQNLKALLRNRDAVKKMHDYDIAKILSSIRDEYNERFLGYMDTLPAEKLGGVLLQMPERSRMELLSELSSERLRAALEHLESDDATELFEDIEESDEVKANLILTKMDTVDRDAINKLKTFGASEAGAYMQTEVFDVLIDEHIESALKRYRALKKEGELQNVHRAYMVDKEGKFIDSVRLEDLFLYDTSAKFKKIHHDRVEMGLAAQFVHEHAPIDEVVSRFQDYDLNAIAVIDDAGLLVGRITSDDIHDIIEERATKQMYNLAGVGGHGPELSESDANSWKSRAVWLLVNLCTMIVASSVIGIFEETIASYVALAVLMPIIPALSGNAGIQALTITVRRLAMGSLDMKNAKVNIFGEMRIALFHGITFSLLVGTIATVWFGDIKLGITMSLTVIAALLAAGFLGASIPVVLKRVGVDPAVGSSVVLTGIIDSLSFFMLFGLATLILL